MKAKLISENAELKAQTISNVHAQPVITCFHLCLGKTAFRTQCALSFPQLSGLQFQIFTCIFKSLE